MAMKFEKIFNKQFPSKEIQILTIGKFAKKILMRNCLDRQKVIDTLDKFYYSFNKTDTKFEIKFDKVKKELGLS